MFTLIQKTRIGSTVALGVWRKGKTLEIKATIAESGTSDPSAAASKNTASPGQPRAPEEVLQTLGIKVRDLSVPERMQGFSGVVVTELAVDGLAAKLIQAGDLIVAVNTKRIGGVSEFFLHLAASASVQDTQIQLIRKGQLLRVTVPALPRME